MKVPFVKFIFDRRKKASKTKPGMVEIEIYFEGSRKMVSTGIKVPKKNWDPELMVVGIPEALMLNSVLNKERKRYLDAIAELALREIEFSFAALDEMLTMRKYNRNFLSYMEDKIKTRKDVAEITKKAHRKVFKTLKRFKKISEFTDLTPFRIREFDSWLHEHYECQTTIYSFHKNLKAYINIAIGEGLLTKSPYLGLKFDKGKASLRKFLTEEQVKSIAAVEASDLAVMRARDMFLLQCYTGLAYADLERFDFSSVEERDGRYVMHEKRKKTGQEFYIVLMSPAMEILRRYDYRLPIVSNQKYNQALKVLGAYAGLKINLTSHCARHTYATWCLNKGVPLETLKVMLGHSDVKTTQIYAKILNTTVESAFDMLEGTLSN